MATIYTRLTDVDGYVADRATRYRMADLFDEQDGGVWQEQALCAQVDPEVFFPEKGGSVREAKTTCMRCPVRPECLDAALARRELWGIWGGLSERERRPLLRERSDDVAA